MSYKTSHYFRYGNTNDCVSGSHWITGVSSADSNDGVRNEVSNAYFSLFGRYGELAGVESYVETWVFGNGQSLYGTITNMVSQGGQSSGELPAVQANGKHSWQGQGTCPPPAPVCTTLSGSISVSPESIVNDGSSSATLTWDVSGDKITSVSVTSVSSAGSSGSATVSPSSTTSYYLSAENECGDTISDSVTLEVLEIPLTLAYFRANDKSPSASVYPDEIVTLSWSTLWNSFYNTATSVSIDNGIGSVSTGSGQITISAPTQDTIYTITVSDGSSTLTGKVTVKLLEYDDTPDRVSFVTIEDADLDTTYYSEEVIVSGIQVPVDVVATNGALISVNGGNFLEETQTVSDGNTIQIQMNSSDSYNKLKTSTIFLGKVENIWKIRTKSAPAQIPNTFQFNKIEDAPLLSYVVSNEVVITGINESVEVTSPTNFGESSVNGGTFDSTKKTISNGQTLQLRVFTTSTLGDTKTTGVFVGDSPFVDWEVVNVLVADSNPDYFNFVNKDNQPLNTLIESDIITIQGINVPTNVTVTNGAEFKIDGDSWVTTGTISNGETLQLRILSSSDFGGDVFTKVKVGNLEDTWTVISTTDGDTVPDEFYFIDKNGQPPNTYVESNTVLITGITSPSTVSILGGQLSVDNGITWVSSATINNKDTLKIRVLTSSSLDTPVTASLTIS